MIAKKRLQSESPNRRDQSYHRDQVPPCAIPLFSVPPFVGGNPLFFTDCRHGVCGAFGIEESPYCYDSVRKCGWGPRDSTQMSLSIPADSPGWFALCWFRT